MLDSMSVLLVFWEITRACALSCKHCRAEAQSHRHPDELNRELKPARWSVFLLVPTGRAGIADLPDPQDIEMIFVTWQISWARHPLPSKPPRAITSAAW
jgi:MoaA/NifB/PqqE/SkfB family radical SAM enzyme